MRALNIMRCLQTSKFFPKSDGGTVESVEETDALAKRALTFQYPDMYPNALLRILGDEQYANKLSPMVKDDDESNQVKLDEFIGSIPLAKPQSDDKSVSFQSVQGKKAKHYLTSVMVRFALNGKGDVIEAQLAYHYNKPRLVDKSIITRKSLDPVLIKVFVQDVLANAAVIVYQLQDQASEKKEKESEKMEESLAALKF